MRHSNAPIHVGIESFPLKHQTLTLPNPRRMTRLGSCLSLICRIPFLSSSSPQTAAPTVMKTSETRRHPIGQSGQSGGRQTGWISFALVFLSKQLLSSTDSGILSAIKRERGGGVISSAEGSRCSLRTLHCWLGIHSTPVLSAGVT